MNKADLTDNPNVIIIYKSYTPEKAEYNRKYYTEHKERILQRQKELQNERGDRNDIDCKERKKEINRRYREKLRADPERLERKRQYSKEYYEKHKLKSLCLNLSK